MFLNGEKFGWIVCRAAASSNKLIQRTQEAARADRCVSCLKLQSHRRHMIDNHSEYQLRLIDKYKESVNVYWGALLTINGLLLAFFSIDSLSSTGKWIVLNYSLVVACILSIWLLVWNFKTIKKNYQELGECSIDDMPDVPEIDPKTAQTDDELRELISKHTKDWREKNIKKAGKRQKRMMFREKIIELMLFVETILVLLIIFINKCS